MICAVCGKPHRGRNKTCRACATVIVVNAVEPDACDDPTSPEEEDLVTTDYVTFWRWGMDRKAFALAAGMNWKKRIRGYMARENYYPNVWFQNERGGFTNVTSQIG